MHQSASPAARQASAASIRTEVETPKLLDGASETLALVSKGKPIREKDERHIRLSQPYLRDSFKAYLRLRTLGRTLSIARIWSYLDLDLSAFFLCSGGALSEV